MHVLNTACVHTCISDVLQRHCQARNGTGHVLKATGDRSGTRRTRQNAHNWELERKTGSRSVGMSWRSRVFLAWRGHFRGNGDRNGAEIPAEGSTRLSVAPHFGGPICKLAIYPQTAVCRGGRWTDTAAGSRRHCGRAGVLAPKPPAPGQLLGWVLVVRATLARSEAKSRGRRWRSQGGEEFAYHALVGLALIRTSGENRLNMRCVARLSSVRQDRPGGGSGSPGRLSSLSLRHPIRRAW